MKSHTNIWFIVGLTATIAIILILVYSLLVMFAAMANAHDAPTGWRYPSACCSNKDCRPIPASSCEEVQGGRTFNGLFVPHERIRPSPDGTCHVCQNNKGTIIHHDSSKELPCAWAPMGGF